MRTNELTGPALDWAVAKCEEREGQAYLRGGKLYEPLRGEFLCYSTDWAQGGPIIGRERIAVAPFYRTWVAASFVEELVHDSDGDCMVVAMWKSEPHFYGSNPLIAAMRCLVASKMGDNIDIPKELI